ncbi:hypothetical protein MF406_06445 [Georgenia sp. TF02-10]|uniref:HepT-like ribonuclease domain-containing protein n=1 Tax=Georgenia sp. TF02-10 TaxID=2917725 RepID=UPI001FA7EC81|nr:HepT-like ribonuclease domain-containing protein [Georgenia sp. TF02-10]UNX55865.1 hypothetical protein MF406_06445 [Georgenia sp. TF02-10]
MADALRTALAQCRYITSFGRTGFLGDGLEAQVLRLAGERLIITVQSALDDLPAAFLGQNDDLPFALVRGMRDRLALGHGDVDAEIVWATIAGRLPELVAQVLDRLGR